jgi:hypothetical protein
LVVKYNTETSTCVKSIFSQIKQKITMTKKIIWISETIYDLSKQPRSVFKQYSFSTFFIFHAVYCDMNKSIHIT